MPLRKPALILLAGLILGLAFDRLFHPGALGVNMFVFVALVSAAIAAVASNERLRPARGNVFLFAPLLFFAAMVAVRANSFLTFLNVVAILLLLTLVATYLLREPIARAGLLGYAVPPILAPVMALLRGGQVARDVAVRTAATVRTSPRRSWGPALRGVLLAVPVVIVFGMLLASADTIFSELIRRLLPGNLMEFLGRLVSHGAIVLVVGFILAGGLAYMAWRDQAEAAPAVPRIDLGLRRFLGFTEAAIVINAVNLLFLAFVIVQVPYLFGGRLNVRLDGFTYAEYARRGFGELVGVSVLVLGLLLLLGEFAHRAEGRQARLFNLGSSVMVGLTVVMLVSAFKRLTLYEVAYGFTEMRLYPHVFMVWLAALLGWFLVTLWLRPGRFAAGLFAACVGFVVTLNLINPDAFIVRRNVARNVELSTTTDSAGHPSQEIDAYYLTTLSDDAVPALVAALDRFGPEAQQMIAGELHQRRIRLGQQRAGQSWTAFHLGRWNAYITLQLWEQTPS